MRSKLMLSFAASAAVVLFHPTTQTVWAQGQAAATGTVSSEAEGNMEGVVVTANADVEVNSVTTDAQGRYVFPENRLDPGEYALSIRAVGYDIGAPTKAKVEPEKTATADINLKKTKNLAPQVTNSEWMMSMPGTDDQKASLLNCQGCHTLERIVRSTHDSEELTQVIYRMMGYAPSASRSSRSAAGAESRGPARALPHEGRISGDRQSQLGRRLAVSAQDAASSEGPRHPRHRHPVRHGAADHRAA